MEYSRKTTLLMAGLMLASSASAYAADLSLQEAIDMALAQNTALKVTQKGEITAEETLHSARGKNGVSVSASDSLRTRKNSGSDRSSSNSLRLEGSLPLYSGGANEAAIKSGELGLSAARLKTERERENLKLSVIQAYYDALEAKKTVGVRQETVDKYQEHLTNVSQLYAAGSKARIDVINSSVELSNARQDLIKSENSYEVSLAKLRNYLNMSRTEPLSLTTDFAYAPFSEPMEDAITYAYGHRLDLLADTYAYEQKQQSLKEAKAGYKPTLDLSMGLGHSNAFEPAGDSSNDVSAGVSVKWNIFDGGVTRAKVKSARNDVDVAKLTLDKDKEDIDLALREAYYNMREAEKRFNSTGDAIKQAEENYYIAREKYRAGEGLMLDITDAQTSLSTARLNYISAQYDYARYKAAVENAMGEPLTDGERAAAATMTSETSAEQEKKLAEAIPEQKIVSPADAKPAADVKTRAQGAAASTSASSEAVVRELAGEGTER